MTHRPHARPVPRVHRSFPHLPAVLAAAGALVAATSAVTPAAGAAGTAGAGRVSCREVTYTVDARQPIAGTLCRPDRGRPTATVTLLHGDAYNRSYWTTPYAPAYSTARHLADRGYQSIALDLLGTGASALPSAASVTAAASAAAVEQVLSHITADPRYATTSRRMILAGHSSGSPLAIRIAATSADIDALVTTGFLHTPGPDGEEEFTTLLHPAAEDPAFADEPIPDGYLTTRPGTRSAWYTATASPQVIAADEATKDVVPDGDPRGYAAEAFGPAPLAPTVTVPVLAMVGAQDGYYCSQGCPQAAAEADWYPAASHFTTRVVPDTDHAMALHPTAGETTQALAAWLDQLSCHQLAAAN